MRLVPYTGESDTEPLVEVEFIVLHYTAETLEDTLRIFAEPGVGAGAHLVIARDGEIHEVTPCWGGRPVGAPHAGRSRWDDGRRVWEQFNDFSLGIEIVNWNGNVFPFTGEQYEAIAGALKHLREHYPALSDPARILGHEHIAGWRGKADPGARFDWERLFREVYPDHQPPDRQPACSPAILARLEELAIGDPDEPEERARFWRAVSWFLERAVAER